MDRLNNKIDNFRYGSADLSNPNYFNNFLENHESYLLNGKIAYDKKTHKFLNECGILIGIGFCVNKLNLNTRCFEDSSNNLLKQKILKYKNLKEEELKNWMNDIPLTITSYEESNLRKCLIEDIQSNLKILFENNSKCTNTKHYKDLPIQIKTVMLNLFMKFPNIFNLNNKENDSNNIRNMIIDNFLKCNFDELANSFKILSTYSKNLTIDFKNSFDLIKSINFKCNKNLPFKLLFVVDKSKSISKEDFIKLFNSLKIVIKNIYNPNMNIGMIVFSSKSKLIFDMKKYQTADEILKKMNLDKIKVRRRSTKTNIALNKAYKVLKSKNFSKDELLPPHIILLTDGKSTQFRETIKEANKLKNEGYIISTVRTGNFVINQNVDEFKYITSDKGFVFNLENLKNIENSLNFLINQSCALIKTIDMTKLGYKPLKTDLKIPKDINYLIKIKSLKKDALEIKANNEDKNLKEDKIADIFGSINFSNPNCQVNLFDKTLKNNNELKAGLSNDLFKLWNNSNLSVNNCSKNEVIKLKEIKLDDKTENNLKNFIDYLIKTYKSPDENYILTKNFDFIKDDNIENNYYNSYLIIDTLEDSNIKLELTNCQEKDCSYHYLKALNLSKGEEVIKGLNINVKVNKELDPIIKRKIIRNVFINITNN